MAGRDIAFTGYYQPDCAEADLVYWAKMPTWNSDVAAAILLGLNPEAFHGMGSLSYRLPSGASDKYFSLRKFTQSAALNKQLKGRGTPANWLELALRFDIPVPSLLIQEIPKWAEKHITAPEPPAPPAPPTSPAPASDVAPRERESMLKIIIGIAVEKYRYDPKAPRSAAVKAMEADLERAGVRVIDDTIRRYLREGAEFLPPREV
jgi:hypothetical protein